MSSLLALIYGTSAFHASLDRAVSQPSHSCLAPIGEPSVLGLTSNAVCALVAAWTDFDGNASNSNAIFATPTYLLFGFAMQLVAGLGCFRKNDKLGSTAFTIFSLFWVMHITSITARLMESLSTRIIGRIWFIITIRLSNQHIHSIITWIWYR